MEVELGLDAVDVGDDGVAGVVPAGAARGDVGLGGEDVDKLALACVRERKRVEVSSPSSLLGWAARETEMKGPSDGAEEIRGPGSEDGDAAS